MFPQHCSTLPEEDTLEHVECTADELTGALQSLRRKVSRRHIKTSGALQALTEALRGTTPPALLKVDPDPPHQRVAEEIPTSTNPTAPRVVKRASRTHKKRTRRNRPGTVPPMKPTMIPLLTPTVIPLFTEGDTIGLIQYVVPTPKAPTKLPTGQPCNHHAHRIPTYGTPTTDPTSDPFSNQPGNVPTYSTPTQTPTSSPMPPP